jgi:hypothetical protein
MIIVLKLIRKNIKIHKLDKGVAMLAHVAYRQSNVTYVSINKQLIGFRTGFDILHEFAREGLKYFSCFENNCIAGKVARQVRVARACCTYYIVRD